MKIHTIEVNKFKAASNSVNGLMMFKVDAIVTPKQAVDGIDPSSLITMTNARVLMALLKAQIAEFDGKKAKSRF
jgi:hypothetical protein